MPLFAPWRRLEALPPRRGRDALPGVYEIADDERRILYIGQSASDVPNRIRQHLARPGCLRERAALWRYRFSRVPQADEAEQIARYQARTGNLPPCNRAEPKRRDARRRWSERSRGN